jgi:hypothetical protein
MSEVTPEETARAILRALVQGLRVRAGQGALIEPLSHRTRADGVDPVDLPAGLQHAVDRAWLVHDGGREWVRLTDAGFAAAQSAAISWTIEDH